MFTLVDDPTLGTKRYLQDVRSNQNPYGISRCLESSPTGYPASRTEGIRLQGSEVVLVPGSLDKPSWSLSATM